jgi:hypothetical protein
MITHNYQKENGFANSDEFDLTAIIQKLKEDKLIRFDDSNQFKISLDGRVFIAKGRYQGEIERANAEKVRLYQLKNRQSKLAVRQYYINLTIAIGTGIAAVYYLVGLYWKYHWFELLFPRKH